MADREREEEVEQAKDEIHELEEGDPPEKLEDWPDGRAKYLSSTNGRGADSVMEVVGSDKSLKLAIDLIRPGGTISSVGVHTAKHFSFSPGEAYDKNLTYKSGRCPARFYSEKLLREEVPQQYAIEEIITHEFLLADGATAYEVFDKKLDNCIKAVLRTS